MCVLFVVIGYLSNYIFGSLYVSISQLPKMRLKQDPTFSFERGETT